MWQCGSLSVSQEEWQSDIQLISGALGSVYTRCVCHGSVCHAVNLWHWKDWRLQESNLPTQYTLDPMKGQAFLKTPQVMTRTLTRALSYPACCTDMEHPRWRYCGSISKRLNSVSQCRNIDMISASREGHFCYHSHAIHHNDCGFFCQKKNLHDYQKDLLWTPWTVHSRWG